MLGIKEDSRMGVIQALWNYIKLQGLQDKVDRRIIRADDKLRIVSSDLFCSLRGPMYMQIFGQDAISFQKLPELVNRFLTAPEPVILHYIINPGTPPPERPQAYDVEVKTEDTILKQKMAVTISASKESGQTLLKLDEEVIILSLDLMAFIDNFFLA